MTILIAYILGIISAIVPQKVNSHAKKGKAADESAKPQPTTELKRISAKIDLSPEEAKRYYCEQNKSYTLQKRIFWVNLVTLLALALYTGFTYRILCATKKSAHAAESAADTAARQLELTERPWISSTPNIASPFFMDENGANLVLEFEMKNTGHSPSIGAFTYPKFFVPAHNPEESEFQKRTACDGAVRAAKGEDDVIHPGDHVTKKVKFTWPKTEIAKRSKGGFFLVDIVTCTAYRTSFNDKTYSSPQIYVFYRLGPGPGALAFEVGKDVPIDKLKIGTESETVTVTEGDYKAH